MLIFNTIVMKTLRKISLKRQDYDILNNTQMSDLIGGMATPEADRTTLYCKFGNKIWQCLQLETSCPNGFTTGSCGSLNFVCPKDFETRTF